MNSNDLNEILQDHSQKLVVIMYSSQSCGPCINFKPTFTAFARTNPDCFFVYVDISSFKDPKHQFLSEVKATPKFSFCFNEHVIGDVLGADEKVFVETLEYLKGRINDRHKEIEQQELLHKQQKLEEERNLKIELLKKLYELAQHGVKLTQVYDMNSSVDKMMWEYNAHMKKLQAQAESKQTQQPVQQEPQIQPTPVPQQTSQPESTLTPTPPQQNQPNQQNQSNQQVSSQEQLEQAKKKEKMDKIKELKRIQQMMQMEQFLKLQKLKQLKNIKQQNEKSESESEQTSSEHEEN